MKTFILSIVLVALSGCTTMQAQNQYTHKQAQLARVEADRIGNSGPLYNHYEACLKHNWQNALDSGKELQTAFEKGVGQCAYTLTLLCDFYGVTTCYKDAKLSHKILFSLYMEDYRKPGPKRSVLNF